MKRSDKTYISRDPRLITIRLGGLLHEQEHRLLAQWAAMCAQRVLDLNEKDHRGEGGVRQIIQAAFKWADSDISVNEARKAAYLAIAAAKETGGAIKEVPRAAGHAAATSHMADHALAVAAYSVRAVMASVFDGEKETARLAERQYQIAILPDEIRKLVLAGGRRRNKKFVNLFD